jgi:hypothetical protein
MREYYAPGGNTAGDPAAAVSARRGGSTRRHRYAGSLEQDDDAGFWVEQRGAHARRPHNFVRRSKNIYIATTQLASHLVMCSCACVPSYYCCDETRERGAGEPGEDEDDEDVKMEVEAGISLLRPATRKRWMNAYYCCTDLSSSSSSSMPSLPRPMLYNADIPAPAQPPRPSSASAASAAAAATIEIRRKLNAGRKPDRRPYSAVLASAAEAGAYTRSHFLSTRAYFAPLRST